jgi:hypothetical protein
LEKEESEEEFGNAVLRGPPFLRGLVFAYKSGDRTCLLRILDPRQLHRCGTVPELNRTSLFFAHHDYCRDNVTVAEFLAKKKFRETLHAIDKIGISQRK